MESDWEQLKISQVKLDSIIELSIIDSWAIALGRALLIGQKDDIQKLLLAESSLFFVAILFCFPINLIIFRKLELIANNSNGMSIVLLAALLMSAILLSIFNYFLWQKAKQLKLLSKLLEKVAAYNSLIDHFQWLENINRLAIKKQNNQIESSLYLTQSHREFKETLELIKTSLLDTIELESLVYKNRQAKHKVSGAYTLDRDRLLASLEHNLIELSLPASNSDREYRELFEEAVNLGLSLHREIRKIPKL